MKIRYPKISRASAIVSSLLLSLASALGAWQAQNVQDDARRVAEQAQRNADTLQERTRRIREIDFELGVVQALSSSLIWQGVERAESGANLGLHAADTAVEMAVRRMGSLGPELIGLVDPAPLEFNVLISRHEEVQRSFQSDPAAAYQQYASFLGDLSVRAAENNVRLGTERQVATARSREDLHRAWSRLLAALTLIFAILPTALSEMLPRKDAKDKS